MELTGHHIVPPNTRDKRNAVCGRRRSNLPVDRIDEIRMHKIPVVSIRNPLEQRTGPLNVDLIPAHVGNFQHRIDLKPPDPTRNDAESFVCAELLALREQQLEPQTNSEKWFSRLNRCTNRFC